MKTIKHKELTLLLVGSLVVAAPVFAKNGQDDNSNGSSGKSTSTNSSTSGTSGTSGTSSTSGAINSAGISCSTGKASKQCTFAPSTFASAIKGAHKKIYKQKGAKQDLTIQVSVAKKGTLVTQENFDNETGVIKAIFPDGTVCEFESKSQSKKSYNYLLDTRVRKSVYTEKEGSCSPAKIPLYNGNDVLIEFDADDNSETQNTEIARIRF